MNTWSIAGTALIVLTSIWVLIDALVLGIKKTNEKSMMNMGAASWFICSLLLWIIVFPLYLVKRQQHLAASRNRAVGNRGLATACPSCSASLTVTPELFGEVIECPTCQNQFVAPKPPGMSPYHSAAPTAVAWCMFAIALACLGVSFFTGGVLLTREQLETQVRDNIEKTFRANVATMGTQIQSFNLVHEGGNKYKGMLATLTGTKKETAEVDVTYDGKTFLWKILPVAVPIAPAVAVRSDADDKARQEIIDYYDKYSLLEPYAHRIQEYIGKMDSAQNDAQVLAFAKVVITQQNNIIEGLSALAPNMPELKGINEDLIALYQARRNRMQKFTELLAARNRKGLTEFGAEASAFQTEMENKERDAMNRLASLAKKFKK